MKALTKTILAVLPLLVSTVSHAAFMLNGTRYVFPSDKKVISVRVSNEGDVTFGGQVWVEDPTGRNSADAHFVMTPNFFKVKGHDAQMIRMLKVNSSVLPEDRESLFILNVQEIPPAPAEGSNALSLAVDSRVKLIYRPSTLMNAREGAEARVKVSSNGSRLTVNNPTPYFFAVTDIRYNHHSLTLSEEDQKKVHILAPFSEASLAVKVPAGNTGFSYDAIDDYGATNHYPEGDKGASA